MYKIKFNDKVAIFDPKVDSNLLTKMEDSGMPIEYGCLVGVCGVCKVRVTEGRKNIIEVDEGVIELCDNEILTCCCLITGDVSLEII